jgi:hypothetical protein
MRCENMLPNFIDTCCKKCDASDDGGSADCLLDVIDAGMYVRSDGMNIRGGIYSARFDIASYDRRPLDHGVWGRYAVV